MWILKKILLRLPIMLACGAICWSYFDMLRDLLVCTKMRNVEIKSSKAWNQNIAERLNGTFRDSIKLPPPLPLITPLKYKFLNHLIVRQWKFPQFTNRCWATYLQLYFDIYTMRERKRRFLLFLNGRLKTLPLITGYSRGGGALGLAAVSLGEQVTLDGS